jgi:holin-like protein
MLVYLTLIFICQLAGEFIVSAAGLPVPGPVVGMALLFAGLLVHGALPDDLGKVADALISNLSLLFIPAGVGVLLHGELIGTDLLPISVSLVVSTLLTVAVAGSVMAWLDCGPENNDGGGDG